jgi:hypothetical protein
VAKYGKINGNLSGVRARSKALGTVDSDSIMWLMVQDCQWHHQVIFCGENNTEKLLLQLRNDPFLFGTSLSSNKHRFKKRVSCGKNIDHALSRSVKNLFQIVNLNIWLI